MPDPAPAPLDPEMFVRQCTLVDRQLNADPGVTPNFVTADFLIARAIIETGVTQSIFSDPFCTGPFRLSWTEWIDFLNSELQTHSLYQLPDVIYPMAQVYAAGLSMHAAGKAFADTWAAGDAPDGDAEPFVPSYLDLFHAYLTDVATAVAIRKNETDTNKLLSDIASLASIAPIASRAQLSQVNGSMTITAFVAATEAVLAAALDAAFELWRPTSCRLAAMPAPRLGFKLLRRSRPPGLARQPHRIESGLILPPFHKVSGLRYRHGAVLSRLSA